MPFGVPLQARVSRTGGEARDRRVTDNALPAGNGQFAFK